MLLKYQSTHKPQKDQPKYLGLLAHLWNSLSLSFPQESVKYIQVEVSPPDLLLPTLTWSADPLCVLRVLTIQFSPIRNSGPSHMVCIFLHSLASGPPHYSKGQRRSKRNFHPFLPPSPFLSMLIPVDSSRLNSGAICLIMPPLGAMSEMTGLPFALGRFTMCVQPQIVNSLRMENTSYSNSGTPSA